MANANQISKTVVALMGAGNMPGAKAMVKAAGNPTLAKAFEALLGAEQTLGQVKGADLAAVEATVCKAPDNVPGRQARTAFNYAKRAWPKSPEAVVAVVASVRGAFAEGAFGEVFAQVDTGLGPVKRAIEDAYRAEALARKAVSWGKQGKDTTLAWSSR